MHTMKLKSVNCKLYDKLSATLKLAKQTFEMLFIILISVAVGMRILAIAYLTMEKSPVARVHTVSQ